MDERKRTLVGDATIPLADVFQMISMSQKEGTLIVSDQESRKCIYFGKEGVQLLASGKRRAPKLGDRLVRSGRLSPEQLQEFLAEQKKTGRKFGEIAVARNIVTEEELHQLLRVQIEDEICDCFVWKYSHFEFYEGPPPDELLGKDLPITRVALNVNALLMEALRRRDEWSLIQQQIPDGTITFTWTEEGKAQIETLRADPASSQVIANLDGVTAAEGIVDGTLLSAFDVYRVLYDYLQKGLLREVSPAEALETGRRLAAQGHADQALPLLQRTARRTPGDPAVFQALAQTFVALQQPTEAVEHFRLAAEQWVAAGQPEAAQASLQEAVRVDPQSPAPRLALVQCLLQGNQGEEAYRHAEELLGLLADRPGSETSAALCEAVLQARPTDLKFRCALARARAANGDRDRARAELRLALQHVTPAVQHRGQWYREMIAILPDFTEARVALDRLMTSSAVRRRRFVLRLVGFGIPLALLGAAGAAYWRESGIRSGFEAVAGESRALRGQGKFDEAREVLQKARTRAGVTLLHGGLIDEELAAIDRELARRLEEERKRLGAAHEVLEKQMGAASALAEKDGRIEDAIPLFEIVLEESRKLPPNDFERRAKVRIAQLQNQVKDAQNLRAAAEKLEREEKYGEACREIAKLVNRYPRSRAAQGVSFPLHLQSFPPGAMISVNGEETRLKTPAVARIPLQGPVRIALRRDGFEPFSHEVTDTTVGALQPPPELKKAFAWRLMTGGALEASPAVSGNVVLAGSSDGHVYAAEAARGSLIWEFKDTGAGGEIVAPLCVAGDVVYFSSNDRYAYAVAIPGGPRLVWKVPIGPPLGRPPALDPSGSTVYLAGGDRRLHAIDRQKGTPVWTPPLDLADVPGAPAAFSGAVVVGTASGNILAVDAASGKPRWQFKAGGAVTAAPVLAGDLVLVGAGDGVLYALRAAGGTEAWKYQTGAAIVGSAAAAGDVVLVGSRDKSLYALSLRDGRLLETFTAAGPLLGTPVVHDGVVYVGSDDGTLYALRLEGAKLRRFWSFRSDPPAPVRSTPAVLGKRLFVGSNDRHLYALDIE